MESGEPTQPVEQGIEIAAAGLFAAAAAYSFALLGSPGGLAVTIGVAGAGFAAALAAVRGLGGRPTPFTLAAFEVNPIKPEDAAEELFLSGEQIHRPEAGDELLLDDVLASLAPDSRVVRLFDPAAMPSAGELHANIDRHLRSAGRPAEPHDASQALSDALAELRRSLR